MNRSQNSAEIYYLLLFVPALRCGKPVWSPLESKVCHPCLASGLSSRFSASLWELGRVGITKCQIKSNLLVKHT